MGVGGGRWRVTEGGEWGVESAEWTLRQAQGWYEHGIRSQNRRIDGGADYPNYPPLPVFGKTQFGVRGALVRGSGSYARNAVQWVESVGNADELRPLSASFSAAARGGCCASGTRPAQRRSTHGAQHGATGRIK